MELVQQVNKMEKHTVSSQKDWQARKEAILGINQESLSADKEPRSFPCVAVVAYMGEGWDEIDFVYLDELVT